MPCRPSIPTISNKIALVGEAPGAEEEAQGQPFVGASGKELNRLLQEAGIARERCLVTNVFMERPPGNQIKRFTMTKTELKTLAKDYPEDPLVQEAWSMPMIASSMYIRPEKVPEIHRLREELKAFKPNVVVAFGGTALWALTQRSGIGKYRGAVQPATLGPWKVLPTFHPAAMLRQWNYRPTILADLLKARRESSYPDIQVRNRLIWLDPTLEDLWDFYNEYIEPCTVLSCDIESAGKPRRQITCVGLAPSSGICLVVPFVDRGQSGYSYWKTAEEEASAWDFLRNVFRPNARYSIVGQNFTYDWLYFWETGILVPRYHRDTMLKHHALYPELPKNLGFLGSVHTNSTTWKTMRKDAAAREEREK